jgi:hypothetical protein
MAGEGDGYTEGSGDARMDVAMREGASLYYLLSDQLGSTTVTNPGQQSAQDRVMRACGPLSRQPPAERRWES